MKCKRAHERERHLSSHFLRARNDTTTDLAAKKRDIIICFETSLTIS